MPKLVSEIAPGMQFQRSSENRGTLTDSQTRVFRILLNNPGEIVSPQTECKIKIGDRHPVNGNIYCISWDAKFDGDSRTVLLVTFNYQSTPASNDDDKNKQPPDIRPANWSTSTSLAEMPVRSWREVVGDPPTIFLSSPACNINGDMYDGVSRFEPIVTITIEQYCMSDPTEHCLLAGSVNDLEIMIGTLVCPPGSVMFRGVQTRPTVEAWGDLIYRGWTGTYEFAYRQNYVEGLWNWVQETTYDADCGWDTVVPHTGFNVKCDLNAQDVEKAGMPLKHEAGKILGWENNVALPTNVAVGQKARGMVLVHEYENGGASQMPSAQPIPLNMDGTPRSSEAEPKVLLRRYRTARSIDFVERLKLRLL